MMSKNRLKLAVMVLLLLFGACLASPGRYHDGGFLQIGKRSYHWSP